MSDALSWISLAVGIVAVLLILETLLRTLFTHWGTPQGKYPHRT